MNIKKIGVLVVLLILVNQSIYQLFPLPSILNTLAMIGATLLLMFGISKGGMIGKGFLVGCFLVAIYALVDILSTVGMILPWIGFLAIVERWVMIIVVGLLIFQFFTN